VRARVRPRHHDRPVGPRDQVDAAVREHPHGPGPAPGPHARQPRLETGRRRLLAVGHVSRCIPGRSIRRCRRACRPPRPRTCSRT
jgi:hypothetical protein